MTTEGYVMVPRWEYRVVKGLDTFAKIATAENLMNEFGAEGWELVVMVGENEYAWLKRPAGLVEVRA